MKLREDGHPEADPKIHPKVWLNWRLGWAKDYEYSDTTRFQYVEDIIEDVGEDYQFDINMAYDLLAMPEEDVLWVRKRVRYVRP